MLIEMKSKHIIERLGKCIIHCCIFLFCLSMPERSAAQIGFFDQPKDSTERYVSVTMHLYPPYIPFLGEYADARSDQFMVRMVLNDISMRYDQMMVKVTLEGSDIIWKSYIRPVSFSGIPMIELKGADFVPFFASINTSQNASKLGMLQHFPTDPYRIPDGLYRIGVEITGFGTWVRPTKIYTPYYPFFLDDPPKIQIPKNKIVIRKEPVQNVLFKWKPYQQGRENQKIEKVAYLFELFVVRPGQNPIESSPDWTYTATDNNFILTDNDYKLQPNTKYAWRVRITAENINYSYFRDSGYSNMFTFEYADSK